MRMRKMVGIATVVAVTVGAVATSVAASAGATNDRIELQSRKANASSTLSRTEALPRTAVAGATSRAAVSLTDPLGDLQPALSRYYDADLTGLSVKNDSTGTKLVFAASTRVFTDPRTSHWRDFDTFIDWFVDVNGDDVAEYEVTLLNYLGVVRGDVWVSDPSGTRLCGATPAWSSTTKVYSVTVAPSCFGNAGIVRSWVGMKSADAVGFATDVAPEIGWTNFLPTGTLPNAPSKPMLLPTAGGVIAEWVPPLPSVLPVTDYLIQVSVNNGNTWTNVNDAVGTSTSATITGIEPSSTAIVRVTAATAAGTGPASPQSAGQKPLGVPGAPTAVKLAPSDGGLQAMWTAPASNGGAPITGYKIQYRVTGSRSAQRITPRIVGGSATTVDSVPWQVEVELGNFLCGGTLIDSQWVLTAAHCIVDSGVTAAGIFVHSDSTFRSEMNELNAIGVDQVQVHPSYVVDTQQNDVALLHLKGPAAGTPIPLYTDTTGPTDGTLALISGWGTLFFGGPLPDQLQSATVGVIGGPSDGCGSYGAAFTSATMLCAGFLVGGVDTCQGDSGGPLVVEADTAPKVAGITSFGFECARANSPGIYTRVSTYVAWIRSFVGDPFAWTTVTTNCNAANTNCTYVDIPGLTNGQTVEVRVLAQNVIGTGAASSSATATVDPSTAVAATAPTGIVASPLSGRVALSWTPPVDPIGGPVAGYEVSRDGGATWVKTGTSAPSFAFTGLTNGTNYSFKIRALNVAGPGVAATSAVVKPSVYGYVGVNPTRLLSTRSTGGAIVTASPRGLVVGGKSGIPTSVVAVALSVTVDTPAAAGSLTVWACGATRPTLPNVTFRAGQLSSQLVISRLGSLSRVCIYTTTPAHVVVDALGYYPTGSKFTPMNPTRLASGVRATNSTLQVQASNRPGIPAGAKAVALKITASGSTASGSINVYRCDQAKPASWSLWFQPGKASSDTIYVTPGADGKVCVFTTAGVNVAVDAVGYVPSVGMYVSTGLKRLVDTRSNGGTVDGLYAKIGTRASSAGLRFKVLGRAGVASDASSVAVRVTVVAPTAAGYVQIWPCGATKAGISVAFAAGQTFTGTVLTKIGADGKVCMQATKAVDVVIDLDGYVPKL